MQKQRGMRHQQEEPNFLQSLPTPEVPVCRYVQERLPLRPQIQLVQDPLPPPGTGGVFEVGRGQQQLGEREQVPYVAIAPATSAPAVRVPTPFASALPAEAASVAASAAAQLLGRPPFARAGPGHPHGPVQQETTGAEGGGGRRDEKDSSRSNVRENLVVVCSCFAMSLLFYGLRRLI